MRRILTAVVVLVAAVAAASCAKGQAQTQPSPRAGAGQAANRQTEKVKPYGEVITAGAQTDSGLFIVHKVEDKFYYEIPVGLLDREMLLVSRRARTAANIGYGGEKNNTQTVRWQRHDNKILLRIVSYTNVAADSLPIYEAVRSANFEPIVSAFDIEAFKVDSTKTDTAAAVVDVTSTGTAPSLAGSRASPETSRLAQCSRTTRRSRPRTPPRARSRLR